jgi:hypothetical protein
MLPLCMSCANQAHARTLLVDRLRDAVQKRDEARQKLKDATGGETQTPQETIDSLYAHEKQCSWDHDLELTALEDHDLTATAVGDAMDP